MIFAVIVPIFLLLGLGYLAVKLGLLTQQQTQGIGAFVIKIALPAMFLESLAAKNLQEIWFAEYFYVYAAVTFLLYGSTFFLLKKAFSSTHTEASVLALGASMSNTGLIGTAVLTLLMGQNSLTYTSLVVIIESVFLVPMVLVLTQLGKQHKIQFFDIAKNTLLTLVSNPLFMGVMLGILFAIFQIKIPIQISQALALLGQTASPLALFSIGGGIVGLSLKYINVPSLYLVFSSNILMPLLMFIGLKYLTDVSQEMLYAGTLIAALPMPTIFAMLGQANGLTEKTLTPLLMSTVVGFITVAALIGLWWS